MATVLPWLRLGVAPNEPPIAPLNGFQIRSLLVGY